MKKSLLFLLFFLLIVLLIRAKKRTSPTLQQKDQKFYKLTSSIANLLKQNQLKKSELILKKINLKKLSDSQKGIIFYFQGYLNFKKFLWQQAAAKWFKALKLIPKKSIYYQWCAYYLTLTYFYLDKDKEALQIIKMTTHQIKDFRIKKAFTFLKSKLTLTL